MKQITESYVSFETAKLLKEKGFDELCIKKYKDGLLQNAGIKIEEWQNSELDKDEYSAPTHQMALKWVREVHKIVIEINMEDYITEIDGKLTITYSYIIWHFNRHLNEVGKDDIRYTDEAIWDKESHDSYEEAVEAAIKYTLENLI